MKTRRPVSMLAALAVAACAAWAQTPEGPPKPTAEHKKLDWFAGTWSGKGEAKPSPMMPGGPMTWTEKCEWFEGGFSLVCRSEGKGPAGPMKGLSVIGYNPEKKVYTFYGVDNSGWSGLSEGTTDGKKWTYTSTETMGGQTMQGRFTLTPVSDKKMTFVWEMSQDGKTWTSLMTGESTKP